jgi:hypothetical protein
MVSSTQSKDGFGDGPYYFRVAPENSSQAAAGMKWARGAGLAGVDPFFVFVPGDAYSKDLYEQYREIVGGSHDEERDVPYASDRSVAAVHEAQKVVDDVLCRDRRRNAPWLVVYTARANDFSDLLQKFDTTDCASQITVLAGDDIVQTLDRLTEGDKELLEVLGNQKMRVIYTPFGPTRATGDKLYRSGPTSTIGPWGEFIEGYHTLLDDDLRVPARIADYEPNSHLQGAFDAVTLLAESAKRLLACVTPDGSAAEDSGSRSPDCMDIATLARAAEVPGQASSAGRDLPLAKIYAALRTTTGGKVYQGVSGCVDFGKWDIREAGRGAEPAGKIVAVQRIQAKGDKLVVTDEVLPVGRRLCK